MNSEETEGYQAQQNLQQQEIEGQQAMYAPQIHEQVQQAQAVLVEQTNPNKVVEAIILRLRGKKKNPDGSETQVSAPKMNEIGIENMWFILDSFVNQHITLSHFDSSTIKNMMRQIAKDLTLDLQLNWREYGIKKKTDMDTISNSILININACFKRAEGQGEKNWLSKISVEQISSAPHLSRQKKDNFWSKFRL